jgi:hypothetical protein
MPPWDNLPPELVSRIPKMRAEAMFADANHRRVDRIIDSFWITMWRARLRVYKHRLTPVHSSQPWPASHLLTSTSVPPPLYTRRLIPSQWPGRIGSVAVKRPSMGPISPYEFPLRAPKNDTDNLGTTPLSAAKSGRAPAAGKNYAPPPPCAGLVGVKTLECERRLRCDSII